MANNETYTCSPSEVCLSDSDSELLIPTPWFDESKNEKREKDKGTDVMNDKGEQVPNHVVKKGNLEFMVCKEIANPGVNKLVDKGRLLKRKMVYVE
ncbi:hypothetical protein Tco_1474140 [Tanacetum coccineum]